MGREAESARAEADGMTPTTTYTNRLGERVTPRFLSPIIVSLRVVNCVEVAVYGFR